MQDQLSSQRRSGCFHVVAAASRAAAVEVAALASAERDDLAFGEGLELALARSGDQDEAPEWIQLFPRGPEIKARDGRKWTLADPGVLVTAFAANGADLPGDINHASEILAPKGEEAPAQGWIKEIEIRDGVAFARVDWTAAGRQAVVSKSYKYVSPGFRHTKDGKITRVTSFALVTHPALDMPALAHLQPAPPENPTMSLAARLALVYGLAAGATDAQIEEAATTQVALARDARDPTKLVPAADLTAALTRATKAEGDLLAIATEAKSATAVALVDAAVAAGKIAPASKDDWLSMARENPERTEKVIAGMPVTLTPPTDLDKKPEGETGEAGLTSEQLAVARELGVEPATFAASLKEISQ